MPLTSEAPHMSVVIPVFRKSGNIDESLVELMSFFHTSRHKFQLVIVDDGCTSEYAQRLLDFAQSTEGIRLITHTKNLGKGRSIADGVAVADAPLVAFIDIDISYELSALEYMCDEFDADPRLQFIVGSRRHPDSDIKKNYNIVRRFFSWSYNILSRLVIKSPVTDVQCGIKGFRHDAARLLFSDLTVERYAFDVELFLRARRYELRFKEMPITYRHPHGPALHVFSGSITMLMDLWRLYGLYKTRRH